MKPQEHITVCASEEAGEVAELAFELGRTALKLSKDLHKALHFGFTNTDPETGKTKIEMLVSEIIDLKACIELLQESGVPLFGLDNRDAIEAKKDKVMKYLKIAEGLGTVEKPKPDSITQAERDFAIMCLTEIYNPERQKEYGQRLFDYVVKNVKQKVIFDYTVKNVKQKAIPDGVCAELSSQFIEELTVYKDHLVKTLITGDKYYLIPGNKSFMDMIDVQFIVENNQITIQPNSVLEVLMHGVAQVKFFTGDDIEEVNRLWKLHKHEFQ